MCGLVRLTLRSKKKVLGSDSSQHLVELRNLISLRDSRWPLGWTLKKARTFTNFQVLQLTKVLTERMILQKGALKTSSKFTGEILIKYSSIIPCGDSHKEKSKTSNNLLKHIRVRECADFAYNSNINFKQHLIIELMFECLWDICVGVDKFVK